MIIIVFLEVKGYFVLIYSQKRKPATAGSHFQLSRTSHVQRESSPDDCYFQPFKPKIVLMDNFCSLKPIHIRIDFLDVFVVFEGVVEFFKGC